MAPDTIDSAFSAKLKSVWTVNSLLDQMRLIGFFHLMRKVREKPLCGNPTLKLQLVIIYIYILFTLLLIDRTKTMSTGCESVGFAALPESSSF